MVLMNRTGAQEPVGPEDPLFLAGSSCRDQAIEDLAEFSELQAKLRTSLQVVGELEGRETELAGLRAYELLGRATDSETGIRMRFHQVIAPREEGDFLLVGLVSDRNAQRWLPELRELTESFEHVRDR